MIEERISVMNLDCRACELRLDRALQALPGVESAVSDCVAERVAVRYDETRVSQEELHRAIRRGGCALPGDGVPPMPRRAALLRGGLLSLLLTLPLLWALPVWMQVGFALVLALFPGREALKKPWRSDTLILILVPVLWAVGVWKLAEGADPRLWLLLGGVAITALLLGRYLEAELQYRALEPVRKLLRLQPRTALIEAGERDVETLRPGDTVILQAGTRIPADGTLLEGVLTVDESAITDAPGLMEKHPGDPLLAGALIRAGDGSMTITAIGDQTALRQKAERLRTRRN